jgi:ABC-2 type transport system permease protein
MRQERIWSRARKLAKQKLPGNGEVWSWLDVIWECMHKDIVSALAERVSLFQMIILPLNYNLLLILFALAGSAAPTAVVMQDHGPSAQQLYDAMQASSSFRLQVVESETEAASMLLHGEIVAVVTIPADFDHKVSHRQPVQVRLLTNNLNTDFTDDVNRGLRLSIITFSQRVFPGRVTIVAHLEEAYGHETGYIPYLSVSVVIIGLLVGGLLQAGTASARDWEVKTIKEVLLSPAPRWAIVVGKMLGAGSVSLLSALAVLLFLILVIGVWPLSWGGVLGTILLMSAVSVAAGTVIGNLLKQRQTVTLLTRGSSVPLFFLSGVFNPITYSTVGMVILARLFPVHYAIALIQNAALGFRTNTLSPLLNVLVLCGFLLLFIAFSSLVLRYGHVGQ